MLVGTYADRIRRYYDEAIVGQNWDYVRELIAPHAMVADGVGPEDKIKPMANALGFTDIGVDIRHLVEAGNQVAVHFILAVTDTGGFARRAPTGKRVSSWGVEFWRFEGEQVVEEWIGFDYLGVFIQLGIVPSPWPTATSV
ncbi:MAG: ester cyclase [Chloroflexota bacterium]|nr:ester cyclase [Chloroflexota bacterium]